MSKYEKSLYSQNGEDGLLAKIFQVISPRSSYFVELAAYDGITDSSSYLLRLQGWKGLLLDRSHEIKEIGLYKEFIRAENINALFEKYEVPYDLDLLCIDVGYNDFYIWEALSSKYQPAVVLIAYNGAHLPSEDCVVKYRPFFLGDGTQYYGSSFFALNQLGKSKGYTLIYAENSGSNLFFIKEKLLREKGIVFQGMNQVESLYKPSMKSYLDDFRHQSYIRSVDILNQSKGNL